MPTRTYSRATEPHFLSLVAALEPVLHNFKSWYYQGVVTIDADFSGTTDQAIQAIVDAAPTDSSTLNVKAEVDRLPLVLQAIIMSLVDVINVERAQHGRAAITKAAALAAVKAKVDAL